MFDIEGKIAAAGAQKTAVVRVSDICFDESLIKLCEMNSCGNYGRNCMCPPLVGNTDGLIEKAKKYTNAAVFSCVYDIEDSFDIEGMTRANMVFGELVKRVGELCAKERSDTLLLGAGGCRICGKCSAIENLPCRHPDMAYPSLESHGIFVSQLAQTAGMKYINGKNTVTYFGAVLY